MSTTDTLAVEDRMTTTDTVQGYFASLQQKNGWEAFPSDDMVFTSFTSPYFDTAPFPK